jgi:hypothetical protein
VFIKLFQKFQFLFNHPVNETKEILAECDNCCKDYVLMETVTPVTRPTNMCSKVFIKHGSRIDDTCVLY